MLTALPVQHSTFRRPLNSAGDGLINVNAADLLLGVLRLRRSTGVFLGLQRDRRVAECRAGKPAYALQDEQRVDIIGKGFVLYMTG